MNVVIIEDEERAATRLAQVLGEVDPEIKVVAKLESVQTAREYLSGHPLIQLIFSDIQLEDGLSFEIFEEVEVSCPIIFTTAYDQYAIEAFQTNGIDYLLKPIDKQRLDKALQKVKKLNRAVSIENIIALANSALSQKQKYKSRFVIKIGERIKSINVEEILCFFSQDNATFLLTNSGRRFVIDYSLDHLEKLIDPEGFFRISRKYIVSIRACDDIVAWSNSRLKVQIPGLDGQMFVVARERVQDFKSWLDR